MTNITPERARELADDGTLGRPLSPEVRQELHDALRAHAELLERGAALSAVALRDFNRALETTRAERERLANVLSWRTQGSIAVDIRNDAIYYLRHPAGEPT